MTTTERRQSAAMLAITLRVHAERRLRQAQVARKAGRVAFLRTPDETETDAALLMDAARMIEGFHAQLRATERSEIINHTRITGPEMAG